MTEDKTSELHDQITEIFSNDASGLLVAIGAVLLAAVVVTTSAIFLHLLRQRSPRVSLPAPRWGFPEVILYLFGWYLLQFAFGSLVLVAFRASPVTEVSSLIEYFARVPLATSAQVAASSLAGLTIAGGILLLPKLFGQPLTVIGLGTGSLLRAAKQGGLVWIFSLPGLLAINILWLYTLIISGMDTAQQGVVLIFRDSVEYGSWATAFTIMSLAIVVAPIVEELLFRVVVFRWLEHRFGVGVGIVGSGVLFGLIHGSLFAFVPITVLGMLLAALFHRTGNIWSCIALHATFNAAQLCYMVIELSRQSA